MLLFHGDKNGFYIYIYIQQGAKDYFFQLSLSGNNHHLILIIIYLFIKLLVLFDYFIIVVVIIIDFIIYLFN